MYKFKEKKQLKMIFLPFMRCCSKNKRSTCIFMSLTHTNSFYIFIIVTFLLFTYITFETIDYKIQSRRKLNLPEFKLMSRRKRNNTIDIEQRGNRNNEKYFFNSYGLLTNKGQRFATKK